MLLSRQANRDYRNKVLDNGLELVIITCPEANKAAVSISIEMGHFNDPEDCPGLSHLLEHMLFTGTERFPDGNHLHSILHKEGGFLNAWTSAQSCNFHFDCPESILEESIDILLDMILHPKFDEGGIEQEILAIEAEFHLRRNDDVRRLYDVHKQTANPKHPFTKFSVGNKGVFNQFSLSELREKLIIHHTSFFSPKNIKITAITSQAEIIGQQIESVTCVLQNASQSMMTQPTLPELYLASQKSCFISVKPYKSTQTLMLTYCLPSLSNYHHLKPILLLTHLLEDSNKDGLQWVLKNEAYIVDLTASGGLADGQHQDININLRLTEKGLNNIGLILRRVDQWFTYLKSVGIELWRFEEKAQQLKLQATHASMPSPVDECILLATRLHKYSLDESLVYDSQMNNYDPAFFKEYLAFFVPKNLRVFCIHDAVETNKITEQYRAPYRVEKLLNSTFNTSDDNHTASYLLPSKNHYMSDDFSIVNKELPTGELREFESTQIKVKFTQNTHFATPKGDCYFSIESPSMIGSARNIAIKRLWIECISEQLAEDYSGAEMAGIYFRVYGHQGGLSIHTSGFSHTQLILCEEILTGLRDLKIKPAVFLSMKEKLRTTLKNKLLNKPINQLFSELNILLQENTFSQKAILNELDSVFLPELQSHADTYFNALHVEGLIVGNWTLAQAHSFVNQIEIKLHQCDKQFKSARRIADIHGQSLQVYVNPLSSVLRSEAPKAGEDLENAVVYYYQAEDSSLRNRCIFVALEKLLSPFIFDELRNKRNLGYLVGCGYMPMNKRPGIAIYVQSPEHACKVLDEAIEQALVDFKADLQELAEDFDSFKASLARQFAIEDANTAQYCQRLWIEFDGPQQKPNVFEEEVKETLRTLSFNDFDESFSMIFMKRKFGYVHLSTQANGEHIKDASTSISETYLEQVKSTLPFVPAP